MKLSKLMLCCEGVKFAFARGRSVLCIACLMFVTETNINGVENSQPQMLPSKRDEFGQPEKFGKLNSFLSNVSEKLCKNMKKQ